MNNIEHIADVSSEQNEHRDYIGAKIGMWLFLFTELLLFGGMFLVYAVYRFKFPNLFHLSSLEMNTTIGTINTIILLTSSLTVVLAISALQKGKKIISLVYLGITELFGLLFLLNKYFEWSHEFARGNYPGSPILLNKPGGEIIFFGLYFLMTGLHGLHVIIGMVTFAFVILFIIRDKINSENNTILENAGLYWHLVDIIWIFLFPLFYLIQ